MCDQDASRSGKRERGAATMEYVMLLGFITALVLFLFGLLFPSAGKDFETLVNQWGDKLAGQIAGEEMSPSSDAWKVD